MSASNIGVRECLKLQLHGAIYRPNSFVLMLRYCTNLKAIRYESMGLNRIVADKSHRVIVALLSRLTRTRNYDNNVLSLIPTHAFRLSPAKFFA